MNWRSILHLDLGSLLRGRVVVPPTSPAERYSRWATLCSDVGRAFVRVASAVLGAPFRCWRLHRRADLVLITEQLARFVAANLPLVPSLEAILPEVPTRRMGRIVLRLCWDLNAGRSLSEAMSAQAGFFPPDYIDSVRTGEDTGTLHRCLTDLNGRLIESGRTMDIVSAFVTYLVAVLAIALSVFLFHVTKILPVFLEVVRDSHGVVPTVVTNLMSVTDWLDVHVVRTLWHWMPETKDNPFPNPFVFLALVLVISIIALRLGVRVARHAWRVSVLGRLRGRCLRALPWVRSLFARSNLSRFADLLAKRLRAGYPLDQALGHIAASHVNPLYRDAARRMRDRVRQGDTLSEAVKREGTLIPLAFQGMVAIGESGGQLSEVLERMAGLYRCQVQTAERILIDTVMPLFVVAVGVFVLLINASMFSMLTSIVDALIENR